MTEWESEWTSSQFTTINNKLNRQSDSQTNSWTDRHLEGQHASEFVVYRLDTLRVYYMMIWWNEMSLYQWYKIVCHTISERCATNTQSIITSQMSDGIACKCARSIQWNDLVLHQKKVPEFKRSERLKRSVCIFVSS